MLYSNYHLCLLKRSNKILEMTKKDMKKYTGLRKKLLKYTEEENPNYREWKRFLEEFEILILNNLKEEKND